MFHLEAEKTRVLLKTVGEAAFEQFDLDAIQVVCQAAEAFVAAFEQEDSATLEDIQQQLSRWEAVLTRTPET